jgi:hypothetical protein
MTMNPKTPKLLPWLAKKAGITERRADHAMARCRTLGRAPRRTRLGRLFKLAVDRLLELVAAESLREDAASFGWRPWARAQARLWAVSMQVAHQGAALSARGWRLIGSAARLDQPG